MANLELSPAVFSILSALLEERVGLHYGLLDRNLLQEKISARALEIGFESLLDYYYYLRYDPGGEEELTELTETLVVSETYFFREWNAIEVLVDSFLEPWCRAGRRPRIWSAACATGEEPLSLAMLLDARNLLEQVELVASDISERALAKARFGKYGRRSVRAIPDDVLAARYILRTNEHYTVDRRLIEAIDWRRVNLLSAPDASAVGRCDVIMCRNVLIYFSDETVKALVNRLAKQLIDDGVLLVGVSESLMRYGTAFTGEELGGAFIYRKACNP